MNNEKNTENKLYHNQTSDYNIEFAHIYVNENYNGDHFQSTWVANRLFKDLSQGQSKNVSTSILIDDYNPSEHILSVPDFISKIEENGITVDFVASEAELVRYHKFLLDSITKQRVQRMEERYIKAKDKVPCSFLVAVWNLVRLQKIPVNDLEHLFKYKFTTTKSPFASKICNVLPSRFKDVEKRAIELIRASEFSDVVDDIEHIFF